MKRAVKILYYLLILSFALPSGTLFSLPIKTVLSLMLLLLLPLCDRKIVFNQVTKIMIVVLIFLSCWCLIAVGHGYGDTTISFLKNFFSLIIVFWVAFELPKMGIVSHKSNVRLLGIVSLLIVVEKIAVSAALTLGVIQMQQAFAIFRNVFNSELTTMTMPIGSLTFYRIMLSNDHIPIVWFSFYLFSKARTPRKIILLFVMALYTFIVYSRVAIAEFGVLLLTWLIVTLRERRQQGKKDGVKIAVSLGVIAIVAVVLLTNKKLNLIGTLSARFNSTSTSASDQIRNEQFAYLWQGFNELPVFGHGAGSYVREYLRSNTILYSYELEYLSFLYQFGIVGFCLVVLPTIYCFGKTCLENVKDTNVKILIIVNLLIWVIRPFFNPSFLSSNAGMIIVIINSYGKYLDYEKCVEKNKSLVVDNKPTTNLDSNLTSC